MVSSRVQEYSESKIELFCGFFIVFNVEKKFKDIISSFNPKKRTKFSDEFLLNELNYSSLVHFFCTRDVFFFHYYWLFFSLQVQI